MGNEIFTSLEATLTMQAFGEPEKTIEYFNQVVSTITPIVVPDVVDGIRKVGYSQKVSIDMLNLNRDIGLIMDTYKKITVKIVFNNADGRSETHTFNNLFADQKTFTIPEANLTSLKYELSKNVLD